MSFQTQLCTFKTADNERLHGLLFTPPEARSDLALLFIHGVAMNFYLPPLAVFGQELAKRRYHSFVINTRGHDWISRAGNLTRLGGSAYETVEDCVADLDAALDWLRRQHYQRFVLVGHSLGAIKSIIYQSKRQRRDVIGIVACSPPKQFHAERAARHPGFHEILAHAESLVEQGKGDEVLSLSFGNGRNLFSARTLLNKFSKDNRNDLRPHAKRLGCPVLVIVGGSEADFFYEYAREIAAAAGPNGICRVVHGANHFYNRHTSEIVGLIYEWLEQFDD
jgi:pimeloyl-ACP methyl ester carboxylesterase